jgi:hypothetical protein
MAITPHNNDVQSSGGPDECQVAADTYQCGRDLALTVTDDIFTRSKGNKTIVS